MFHLRRDKGAARPGAVQPKKVTAKDRRCAALRELGGRYRTAEAVTEAGREQIAADIDRLLGLGKTDAWKGAIKDWAAAVRRDGNRPELGLLPVRRLRGQRSLRHPAGASGNGCAPRCVPCSGATPPR